MPYHRILFLLSVLLWASGITSISLAASKIVILTSKTDNSELTKAANQGLLSGFQQTYEEGKTIYPLNNGYQIELASYPGAGQNSFAVYGNDKEVVALICLTDTDCEPVLDAGAPNTLVIALTATTSILGDQKNVLRIAPSNKLEGKIIYKQLKQDKIKRFAVLYEPTLYAMNLYSGIMGEYFIDVVKAASATVDKPAFVSAFPITDFMGLSAMQQGTTAAIALKMLPRLNVDAVVFAGYSDAFKALTDSNKGGNAAVVKNWYSSGAIYPSMTGTTPVITPFTGLQVMALYMPDDKVSTFASYYYAFDAAIFLQKVISAYDTTGSSPTRDKFLEIAKKTNVPIEFSKTGTKSFTEADDFARFNLHIYSATSDNPAAIQDVTKETSVTGY